MICPPRHWRTQRACSVSCTSIQNTELLAGEAMGTRCGCLELWSNLNQCLDLSYLHRFFLFSMLLQILYPSCLVCGILFKSEMHATQALSGVFIFLGKQEVSTNILGTAVCYRCHTSARKCSWANSERKFPSEGFAFHQHLKNIFPLAIIMLVSINYNDVK